MAKNFSERLNEQLVKSPLVQETDRYMEQQVLNPDATPVNIKPEDVQPQVVEPKPEKKAEPKYPAPFMVELEGTPTHCQALVPPATYFNMGTLKHLGVVPKNMSFGAMATQALEEWVDRKIKEWVKKQK